MGRGRLSYALLGTALALLASCDVSEAQCTAATTCSECMDAGVSCQWCSDETEVWRRSGRCRASFDASQPCSNTVNLRSSVAITQNLPFSNDIQVQPQGISAQLRPRESIVLTAKVRPARNYPLDVYYLMDHSRSMLNDLQTMQGFASSISASINNLTTGYRLGYGTYVDKPAMPFIATSTASQTMLPCIGCKRPYAYQNTLPLTRNATRFSSAINADTISGNLDSPEGTLNAMVQAAVCTSQVGWRDTARRVLLIATDAVSHIGGDGFLLGISKPDDGKCHLDSTGYVNDFDYDYPSISYVSHIMRRERILPIFMATTGPAPFYLSVVRQMASTGASLVTLSADSDNILNLLNVELSRLVRVSRIIVLPQTGVNISVRATCPDGVSSVIDPDTGFEQCTNLDFDKEAQFSITLTGVQCSLLANTKEVVLRMVGYGDIKVNISSLCQCPCEAAPMVNSSFCSSQGNSQCGVCNCNSGFRNKQPDVSLCDCNTVNNTPCVEPGSNMTCSGRGDCVCQECQCGTPAGAKIPGAKYLGRYCECDNFNCPSTDAGDLCGGPNQGDCMCGTCQCKPGFSKIDCSCPASNSTCIKSGSSEMCSGAGRCVCGQCQCDANAGGDFCENCLNSFDVCGRAMACFNCTGANSNGRCQAECPGLLEETSESSNINGQMTTQCTLPVSINVAGCDTNSYYAYEDLTKGRRCNRPFAPFTGKACPQAQTVNYVPITVGPALALILVALLILAFIKLYIFYRERREFKQFNKEAENARKNAGQGHNPIFKKATKVYYNPEYQGNESDQQNGEVKAEQ